MLRSLFSEILTVIYLWISFGLLEVKERIKLLGGIIVIIGITYLIRFLRKYQLPQEEINKDG